MRKITKTSFLSSIFPFIFFNYAILLARNNSKEYKTFQQAIYEPLGYAK